MFRKHGRAPVKFTLCMETVYVRAVREDGRGPRQDAHTNSTSKEENTGRCLSEDFRLAYDLHGGEYTDSFAEIGQILEDHFDRERESSSSSSDSD